MWYGKCIMDETTNSVSNPNKSRLRITERGKKAIAVTAVAGVGLVGAPHIPEAVEAAQRILNPEPAAVAEAGPQTIGQQEMNALIENFRESGSPLVQFGNDILVSGPETRLFDEGLAQIPVDILGQNQSNIQESLLVSSKTANTDQPETPYITQPGQVYAIYETDLNNDGLNEYVVSLKPAPIVDQLPTI